MVDIQNWDAIPDAAEYERPVPGGYIGVICDYLDVERPIRNGKSQFCSCSGTSRRARSGLKQRVLAADEFLAQLR